MKNSKSIVLFLIKFFGTYALLFVLYATYLNKTQQKDAIFTCAPITKVVAEQSEWVLNVFNYKTKLIQSKDELSMQMHIEDIYVSRVIEGCNAISIIILFVSFIVAFSTTFKRTILFIVVGSLLIYSSNVIRIALISAAIYEYPGYTTFLHDFLFPALIYGLVFLLWFLWVFKFSKK